MSKTEIITKPLISGTVVAAGPLASLFTRSAYRVYPYQPGCFVRSSNGGGSYILTDGMGAIDQYDYIIPCSETYYGEAPFYIPDLGRITRVTSFYHSTNGDVATQSLADDDRLNISPAVAVYQDEFLLCIGADGASNPLAMPNFDGTDITIYEDNAGNSESSLNYLQTGASGMFYGWIDTGNPVVSLLVTDNSGTPVVAVPFISPSAEVVVV